MITTNLANIRTLPPATAPITHTIADAFADLTDGQRYGLLQVRGGQASAALRRTMDAMGWPQPEQSDWIGLIRRGFVKARWSRWAGDVPYDLLPMGLTAAGAITGDLSRKFNVHIIAYLDGSHGVAPRAKCSCERWSQTVPRNSSANTRLSRAADLHIRHMRDDPGGVARKSRLDAICDQLAADGAEARARFDEARHA